MWHETKELCVIYYELQQKEQIVGLDGVPDGNKSTGAASGSKNRFRIVKIKIAV